MTSTNRVLVTGASGFLGTHLTKALGAAGYWVEPHSSRSGDIANCEFDVADVGHVFHLAARTFVPESWGDPLSFYRVNVLGTVNVLEFCRAHNASLTLMSSYVYGRPVCLSLKMNRCERLIPTATRRSWLKKQADITRSSFKFR